MAPLLAPGRNIAISVLLAWMFVSVPAVPETPTRHASKKESCKNPLPSIGGGAPTLGFSPLWRNRSWRFRCNPAEPTGTSRACWLKPANVSPAIVSAFSRLAATKSLSKLNRTAPGRIYLAPRLHNWAKRACDLESEPRTCSSALLVRPSKSISVVERERGCSPGSQEQCALENKLFCLGRPRRAIQFVNQGVLKDCSLFFPRA